MKLMRNLILIKLEDVKDTWDGGIIVKTERAKIPAPQGEVVAIGPDVTEVTIGQTVLFGKFAAQEVGDEVLICEDDVLAVIS